jgi:quercetin dioxygenase-like cupin family protein
MAQEVIFLPPGGGRSYDVGGMRGTIKADGPESDGQHCFSEWTLQPGDQGPPPHLHKQHQEAFYVVEGTMTFQVGEEEIEAPAGSFVLIPAGIVHKFSNPTEAPATCVNVWLPGGFEGYFSEMIERMSSEDPPDPSEIVRLSAESDVFFPDSEPAG